MDYVRDGGKPGVTPEIWQRYLQDVQPGVPAHHRLYTKTTIANFLGWTDPHSGSVYPGSRVIPDGASYGTAASPA
jgi:hypothetical protein